VFKALIPLADNEIHLWFSFHTEAADVARQRRYYALLAKDELLKASKFHFERDRGQYVLTRALLRTALSRYAPVPPEAWRFQIDGFGRPSISAAQAQAVPGLDFNFSHTRGLVLLGVARSTKVGVDAENILRPPRIELAERTFSREEAQELRALPLSSQASRFYELWTLKESYLKARGVGLRIPLDEFRFSFGPTAHIGLHMRPALGDVPQRWKLWQFKPSQDHLVAVCVYKGLGALSPRLVCREAVPLDREREVCALISGSTSELPTTSLIDSYEETSP
jgi:4'-phosphopantetheinyl transferase